MRPRRWLWARAPLWHSHHNQHTHEPDALFMGERCRSPGGSAVHRFYTATSPPWWLLTLCCFHQKSSFVLPTKPMYSGFLWSGKRVRPRSTDSLFTKTKTASANADVSQLFIVTRIYNYPLTVSRACYLEPSLGRVTVRLCFQPHPTFKWRGKKKKKTTTKEQLTR